MSVPPPKDPLPYRPCVAVMLLNAAGKVFVAQRLDQTAEAWQMPQGGIDPGEAPEEAVMRELLEEIGTNDVEIIHAPERWFYYDLPEALQGKLWGGRFRGQEQRWFLMRFLGEDTDININTADPEFSAWKWADPQELPALIVPFKQQLYREVLEEFQPFLER